jgi:hypothetical protein
MKHHDLSIDNYVARVSADLATVGVIVTGSVGRGTERADSDIDLYLIVTDEAWQAAWDAQRLMFTDIEGITYEGGYYDVKLATLSYLDDAADRGDDSVRASLAGSSIAFSRVGDLEARVARASTPPNDQWEARMASFLAQVRLHGDYFLKNGERSGDAMLIHHAAVHTALAASRALLALNRVVYPGPKSLTDAVAGIPRKPDGWQQLIDDLLAHPTAENGDAVIRCLERFHDWPLAADRTLSTFILDNELAWRYRTMTPEYS